MKNLGLLILVFISFIFSSCEDNVSPNEEFKARYVFYSVLCNDDLKQFATIGKSTSTISAGSEFLKGAEISMYWDNNYGFFRDSVFTEYNNVTFSSPKECYYLKNFNFPLNKKIDMEILLPNGKRLFSSTTTPDTVAFNRNYNPFLPQGESDLISYDWEPSDATCFVVPKLVFIYYKKYDGVFKAEGEVEVPISYYEKNTVYTPIYPIHQKQNSISYEKAALSRAIMNLAKGAANSNDYAIGKFAKFKLKIYDKNLTFYYSSTNQQAGEYSVSLEQSDFSNIDGGFGLFGSYYVQEKDIYFNDEYIEQFGYSVMYNEGN